MLWFVPAKQLSKLRHFCMKNTLASTSMEGFRPKLAGKAKGGSRNIDTYRLPSKPSQTFKPRNILKCGSLLSLSILSEPVRGGPRIENLQNFLWSRKDTCHGSCRHLFLFFKSRFHVKLRLLSFTSSMLHIVWSRERYGKTLTPTRTHLHPDGNFFVDRFGLGILRDGSTLACVAGVKRGGKEGSGREEGKKKEGGSSPCPTPPFRFSPSPYLPAYARRY